MYIKYITIHYKYYSNSITYYFKFDLSHGKTKINTIIKILWYKNRKNIVLVNKS